MIHPSVGAPTETFDVVVVGAGHAGTTVATELAAAGYTGSIALIGDEDALPYERPPLSKGFLSDAVDEDGLLLRDRAYWADSGVQLRLGRRVGQVDPAGKVVSCDDGTTVGYGTLVWATGGGARSLGVAGEDGPGTHALRTLADARALRATMRSARRFVVVGGGFVGLEAAAVFTAAGIAVTVLEMQERLLARVTGDVVSDFFLRRHRAAGVDVRLGAAVAAVERTDDRVVGVSLRSGEVVPADHVLVAVGQVPAVAPLVEAGAAGGDGVDVDAVGRTSLPGVHAVGDCSRFPHRRHPAGRARLESIQNATEQARTVARAILGETVEYDPQPWFWSNQFDVKFKTVGLLAGHDATVVRGDPDTERFAVAYLRGRTLLAVDSVNSVRDYVGARTVVGREVDPAALADADRPLKECVVPVAAAAS